MNLSYFIAFIPIEKMGILESWIYKGFRSLGLSDNLIVYLRSLIFMIITFIIAKVLHKVAMKFLVPIIEKFFKKTKSQFDDFFLERGTIRILTYLIPALIVYIMLNPIFKDFPAVNKFMHQIISVGFIIIFLSILSSFLKAITDFYETLSYSKDRPIKGYVQGLQLIFIFIGILTAISILFDIKLIAVFTGLGAIAAVILLIFKDTILGFVASIQLSVNDMVKPGDWISMPSHHADGTVLEMNLNTVKVQNWDMTISTIPTYSLVSESFTNWKGMSKSGGRRIKRSINIDMKSVKFCDAEMIERFRKIKFLNNYIDLKLKELDEYNKKFDIENLSIVNGRRLTNLGVFRKYLETYLRHHPDIHQNMTLLVRHLQSAEKGIPIEVYAFSNKQEWAKYENIQANIFDHILAVIPEFDLKVFELPSEIMIEK